MDISLDSLGSMIAGVNPIWAVVLAVVAYVVRQKMQGKALDHDAAVAEAEIALNPDHPLKARLKQKAGDIFDERVLAGWDDDDTYKELLDRLREEPKDGE
jgi:hypothetical protein